MAYWTFMSPTTPSATAIFRVYSSIVSTCFGGMLTGGTGQAGSPGLRDDLPEPVAVLCEIDHRRLRPEDPDPGGLQLGGDVQRRLAPELHDDPLRLLFFVDREHVLHRERLDGELVRGVG